MRDVADVFDDWARRGRAEGMEAGHGQTAAPLLAALELGPGTVFLDLGCGNGWACRSAADQGATAVGVDASREMVVQAARSAEGLDARFEQADFADLPLVEASVDVAWSMEAVYYAPDPDAVLREVRRVLRPGGVFHMVIDHYEENEASHGWPAETGLPMALRSEPAWAEAFEAAGFTDVRAQRLRTEDPDAAPWKREQGSLHIQGRATS